MVSFSDLRIKFNDDPTNYVASCNDAHRTSDRSLRAGSVSTWARLIKRVYEVDPLECPECGGAMKIISFIERRQTDVIQRILREAQQTELRPYDDWSDESDTNEVE